jgi:hypothetical protein
MKRATRAAAVLALASLTGCGALGVEDVCSRLAEDCSDIPPFPEEACVDGLGD